MCLQPIVNHNRFSEDEEDDGKRYIKHQLHDWVLEDAGPFLHEPKEQLAYLLKIEDRE